LFLFTINSTFSQPSLLAALMILLFELTTCTTGPQPLQGKWCWVILAAEAMCRSFFKESLRPDSDLGCHLEDAEQEDIEYARWHCESAYKKGSSFYQDIKTRLETRSKRMPEIDAWALAWLRMSLFIQVQDLHHYDAGSVIAGCIKG
jgi:hypothetical protein